LDLSVSGDERAADIPTHQREHIDELITAILTSIGATCARIYE